MLFNGLWAYMDYLTNLLIIIALADQVQYFFFPFCELWNGRYPYRFVPDSVQVPCQQTDDLV